MAKFDDIPKLKSYEYYISKNLSEWEAESIARICRKIGKIGKMSKKELERFDLEQEAKKEWERIVSALASAVALELVATKKAYTAEVDAWHKANKHLYQYTDTPFVDVSKNEHIQSIINAEARLNAEEIVNLTKTKALCVIDATGRPIHFKDAIYKAFGDAVRAVSKGDRDFHSAMRDTIKALGNSGCRVDYGGGITRRLDTVVRQNVLWGIKQANIRYSDMVARELGCDGIEIDWHANPRPSHEFMQGKQYVLGKARTINGVFFESADEALERLQDYGCLHYKTPIICGVSEPRYSEDELRRLNEQNAKTYRIGDKTVTGYEATQMMRRLETAIREQKSIRNAAKAVGDKVLLKQCSEKIKAYQAKYKEICEITGFSQEKKRMSVPRG